MHRSSNGQSMAPPDRPFQQSTRTRPAGFNIEVHVDLKYAKNVKGENFVALSMVCAGTNKHAAVLLKTRQPAYVAKKFIKHWIAPFGRPVRIVMDQGGEFEREWDPDAGAVWTSIQDDRITCWMATCTGRTSWRLVRHHLACVGGPIQHRR